MFSGSINFQVRPSGVATLGGDNLGGLSNAINKLAAWRFALLDAS
jgi:hypothetical protein